MTDKERVFMPTAELDNSERLALAKLAIEKGDYESALLKLKVVVWRESYYWKPVSDGQTLCHLTPFPAIKNEYQGVSQLDFKHLKIGLIQIEKYL